MPSPNTTLALDQQGCYAPYATSQIKVLDARALTINTTEFVDTFRDEFGFEHEPENWLSMSGSGVWIESEQTYLTSTRMIRSPKGKGSPRVWLLQSHIYLQAWDSEFRPKALRYEINDEAVVVVPKRGRIVKMVDITPGEWWSGPEDARMHLDNRGHIILTFNMQIPGGTHPYWSYNLTDGNLIHLKIEQEGQFQKNWAPFTLGDELHFVHSFSPLRTLHCDRRNGTCTPEIGVGTTGVSWLRGGTPFRQYRDTNFFVGIARTAIDCPRGCGRVYRPNIVVMQAPPVNPATGRPDSYKDMDVLYVSEPIDFHRVPLNPPFVEPGHPEVCGSYMLPCGFHRWDLSTVDKAMDEAYVEVSINDSANVMVKFSGLEQIVVDVIEATNERLARQKQLGVVYSPQATSQVRCAEKRLVNQCPYAEEWGKQ
ncbi:Beta-mannosyltransferase 1 [Sorochytrium milnesiophthora]